jgi:hypothetical protein
MNIDGVMGVGKPNQPISQAEIFSAIPRALDIKEERFASPRVLPKHANQMLNINLHTGESYFSGSDANLVDPNTSSAVDAGAHESRISPRSRRSMTSIDPTKMSTAGSTESRLATTPFQMMQLQQLAILQKDKDIVDEFTLKPLSPEQKQIENRTSRLRRENWVHRQNAGGVLTKGKKGQKIVTKSSKNLDQKLNAMDAVHGRRQVQGDVNMVTPSVSGFKETLKMSMNKCYVVRDNDITLMRDIKANEVHRATIRTPMSRDGRRKTKGKQTGKKSSFSPLLYLYCMCVYASVCLYAHMYASAEIH